MDISKIDLNFIEIFSLIYSVAKGIFEVEPIEASEKKQKQIRKWANKTYIKDEDFPKKVLKFVDDTRSDAEFIAFLKECFDYIEEKGSWKKQLFEKATTEFSPEVKKAFLELFEFGDNGCVKQEEGKIVFTVDETYAYKRELILHTKEENFISDSDTFNFADAQILRDENGYRLVCCVEDLNDEVWRPINIFFTDATINIEVFRADQRAFDGCPWEHLAWIAYDILDKCSLNGDYLNSKEKALIPLLKELKVLSVWAPLYEEECPNFKILKQYAKKQNLTHLIPLFDKAVSNFSSGNANIRHFVSLVDTLNEAAYEPLWREVFGVLSASQEGYAKRSTSSNEASLRQARETIQNKLHSLGYEGEYPHFYKNGDMKGIHLESNYDISYFVGHEKNVKYIIECVEDTRYGMLKIQFLCGTAFLKKDNLITDVYSCGFNAKGKRLFKTLLIDANELDTLDQTVVTAAKKAECIKLSKAEKSISNENGPINWRAFAAIFIIMGGLFAIMMTAAIFLICCIVTVIAVGIKAVPEMVTQIPWWLLFSISFVGFGGGMAITETIAGRK